MLYQAQVTIASTGTAVPLSLTRAAATWVQVQAAAANNAAGGTLGGAPSPPSGPAGANPGVIIAPSGTQFLPYCGKPTAYDLQTIYVNGTTGDKFNILYFRS
jgi:uncharacterized protein YraI